MRVRCLHCDAENDAIKTAGYCDACGKKLPPTGMVRGRTARAWEEDPPILRQPRAEGSGVAVVLFLIAALQAVCGPVALFFLAGAGDADRGRSDELIGAAAFMIGLAVVFAALGAWALYMPIPAGIVGLVVYLGMAVFDFVGAPELAARGIIVKIAIAIGLIAAISRAARRRSMQRE